jgi:hypothetical protein
LRTGFPTGSWLAASWSRLATSDVRLLIPLVSLAGLWGFTASITLGNVIRDYNTVDNAIAPSIIGLEQTLATERGLTFAWLNASRRSAQLRTQLLTARRATDTIDAALHASTASVRGLLAPTALEQQSKLCTALAGLAGLRAAVDSGTDDPVTAFAAYDAIDSDLWGYLPNTTSPDDSDPGLSQMTQSAIAVGRAEDFTNAARLRAELTGLYDSARQMAGKRLPRLVDRLRRGDDVDVEAESPPLQAGRITEIADVARAFTAVQRTAVEAAVGHASLSGTWTWTISTVRISDDTDEQPQ